MKKRIVCVVALVLILGLMVPLSSLAAINVNKGVYTPTWSSQWVTADAQGMWKGFYIKKADNTLKTDLVKKSDGCWTVPGDAYGTVWEGLNICQPTDDSKVGYLFTALEGGKVEFTMKGLLEVPGCTDVEIGIYKNNFNTRLWPTNGADHVATQGVEVNANFVAELNQNDKVFFLFTSNVESANSPQFRFKAFNAVWRTSASQGGQSSTPSSSSSQPASSTTASNTTSSQSSASSAASSGTSSSGGDVVIDDNDSYYVTPKFKDVTVDEENGIIKLSKKLTLKDFMDSFTVKSGHTLKIKDTDTTLDVTDETKIITDKMVVNVFNQGTPVTVLKIQTSYSDTVSNGEASSGPSSLTIGLIIAAIVIVLAGAGAAVYFLVIKKKKA